MKNLEGCPYEYFKKPENRKQAQSNLNVWAWVRLGGCPEGELAVNWNTYVSAMTRDATRELSKFSA